MIPTEQDLAIRRAQLRETSGWARPMQDTRSAGDHSHTVSSRLPLEVRAEELGIKVDGRWSDERLKQEIAKVEAGGNGA